MPKTKNKPPVIVSKEISWLYFNDRVLDEAADQTVPLLERLKFLGIYSSNLDEFFRVRVATLNRLAKAPRKKAMKLIGNDPAKVLKLVHQIIARNQEKFDSTMLDLMRALDKEQISIVDESHLDARQGAFVQEYFQTVVRPRLFPVMVSPQSKFPDLRDRSIYLAVCLYLRGEKRSSRYALIEIPTDHHSRFVLLPKTNGSRSIILLDDVIRYNLRGIFSAFPFARFKAYTIKLTRDAELDIDDDVFESYIRKIHKSLKQRKEGRPVRLVIDSNMPQELVSLITRKLKMKRDDPVVAGARYHNIKDFTSFPDVGRPFLRYAPLQPRQRKELGQNKSILQAISRQDLMLHFPYDSFDHIIDLLREASLDPLVTSIKITLYRAARNSSVVNALMNAVKNGKSVVAVVELQARFDEEANIYWANQLQEAGARVVFGVPGLKVHAKICEIVRKESGSDVSYAVVGTGNFNEDTAKLYTDHFLMTANKKITSEVGRVFEFLEHNYKIPNHNRLIVSPFNMRKRMIKFIETEIENALQGKNASIFLKLNHLTDNEMIEYLYRAGMAGVKIRLLVRGMFTLRPGVPGLSENISAKRIVDRFLEHARVLIFANGGDEKCYIASADWMPRNLDRRVEVACPILDPRLASELKEILELQWRDNTKSSVHQEVQPDGPVVTIRHKRKYRAQFDIYDYLRQKG
jgi:polyphosphate kinase